MLKPVFIHTPKTAGSSILHSFDWFDYAGHDTYREAVEKFGSDRFYFAVVRHPVDRFMSCMAVVYLNHVNYPDQIRQRVYRASFKDFIVSISKILPDINFEDVSQIQKVLFRSQSEQLKGLPFVIHFEDIYYELGKLFWRTGGIGVLGPFQRLGCTTIEKPELDRNTIQLIQEYYVDDMRSYGYAKR